MKYTDNFELAGKSMVSHRGQMHSTLRNVCFCNIFLIGGISLSCILETPDLAFSYHLESVAITGVCLTVKSHVVP